MRVPPLAVVAMATIVACTPRPDLAQDRAELLRLHELQRQAHVERRAELLVATFADPLYSIAHGGVALPSKAASLERLQTYFDRSTFLAWDDTAPPVIRISPDGRMAYVIVQKEVRLTTPDSTGAPSEASTTYAWLATYEKDDGQWRLHAIASTDHPGPAGPTTGD